MLAGFLARTFAEDKLALRATTHLRAVSRDRRRLDVRAERFALLSAPAGASARPGHRVPVVDQHVQVRRRRALQDRGLLRTATPWHAGRRRDIPPAIIYTFTSAPYSHRRRSCRRPPSTLRTLPPRSHAHSEAAARRTRISPSPGSGSGTQSSYRSTSGPPPSRRIDRLHGHNPRMTAAELARRAAELGLDVVGAAPAAAYDETERHIEERRARGLFAGHEVHDGAARGLVSSRAAARRRGAHRRLGGALLLGATGPSRAPARAGCRGTPGATTTRSCASGSTRSGSGSVAATASSSTRTSTSTARARGGPGVGFYGKNTMLITREHGSWVVLGTLVTDVEIEATAPLDLDCGRCRLCIDACPTGALDEPGVLDANRCLSYWTQAPAPVPEEYREELGASVYGCDICQDVCPWNRGVEKRRRGRPLPEDAVPNVSLVDWLDARRRRARRRARPSLRAAERSALAAAQRALRARQHRRSARRCRSSSEWAASDDPVLADAAAWAVAQIAASEP